MSDELVTAMAEAICVEFYGTTYAGTSEFRWGICMKLARAALAAYRGKACPPEGVVLNVRPGTLDDPAAPAHTR